MQGSFNSLRILLIQDSSTFCRRIDRMTVPPLFGSGPSRRGR